MSKIYNYTSKWIIVIRYDGLFGYHGCNIITIRIMMNKEMNEWNRNPTSKINQSLPSMLPNKKYITKYNDSELSTCFYHILIYYHMLHVLNDVHLPSEVINILRWKK